VITGSSSDKDQRYRQILALIDRLGRLIASERWSDQVNPAQMSALDYLLRSNRFSHAPSHVADYLGTTRGTMSQTLKTLARKGFVEEHRSQEDRRSISYELTQAGRQLVQQPSDLMEALKNLPEQDCKLLEGVLTQSLSDVISRREGRAFGLCKDCRYHKAAANKQGEGGYCTLLNLSLQPEEADLICHEYA
jgi:DNA-binding MarR family transcriptional regulator